MFAILDTETTGGSPSDSKITEIAIFLHDGEKIVDRYVTLINPEAVIPAFITKLTGISNEMVADAPKFYEVAKDIIEITRDAVFVAHNCAFDYGMVRKEFRELGYNYEREQLCTVKSARKIFPGLTSYSLGNLCRSLEIKLENHHRAEDDAMAAVKIFELLYTNVGEGIKEFVGSQSTYKSDHPVANEIIHTIPDACGVYYLKNEKGEIIYINHAKNIRKAVWAHFKAKGSKWAIGLSKSIADVSFKNTGSFLMASLLSAYDVEALKPKFNGTSTRRKKEEKNKGVQLSFESDNLLVIDKGAHRDERSVMIFHEEGICYFGFLNPQDGIESIDEIMSQLPFQFNKSNLIKKVKEYLGENKVEKVIPF